MSVESIDAEHMVWLIKRLALSDEEKMQLIGMARSKTKRGEALRILDEHRPRTSAQLFAVWSAAERRGAIHFWVLPEHEKSESESAIRGTVAAALRRSKRPEQLDEHWVDLPKRRAPPQQGEARLLRVRIDRGELIGRVQITRSLSWQFEGQSHHELRDRIVDVALDLRTNGHLIKAFAAQNDAKAAVVALVSWLAGVDLARLDSRAHKEYVEPLRITQSDADTLERKLKLTNYMVQGPHSAGRYSEMKLTAPQEGDAYTPFEDGDELVAEQRSSVLESLGFSYRFKHEDEYVERPHFGFVGLMGRHGHITFYKNTSYPALDRLLGSVYAQVRPVR